jgi:diphosphomevalonate decarboxylase
MDIKSATAVAHPNIAFIKYWGNRDNALRLPQNGSISMNLSAMQTRTTVTLQPTLSQDSLFLNQRPVKGDGLARVSYVLEIIRKMAGVNACAEVVSENNFPTGAGIASSAAAFAALSLAASSAYGLHFNQTELSRLARRGSGSACRSIPGGFVEWLPGQDEPDSYAVSIAPAEHWNLVDCVAIVESGHKPVGSTQGHALASTSPLQAARVAGAAARLDVCRQAILNRDFARLAEVVELDSNLMHAVMMTSTPALFYWEPASITLMKAIPRWRAEGLDVCYTLDAGPNVHVICNASAQDEVTKRLLGIAGVRKVLASPAGGPAALV